MIQVEFTPEAIAALHHARFHHPHPRVQRKMEVLLLKSNGLSHKQIARITRVSVNTIPSDVHAYHAGGIERLKQVNFYKPRSPLYGNRSASENLTLAIRSPYGIPCPHGNTTCITPRGVGTDSP